MNLRHGNTAGDAVARRGRPRLGAVLLLLCCPIPGAAETSPQAVETFSTLASALSAGDAVEFMRPFDKDMPGAGQLRTDVSALLLRAEVLASVEFLSDEGGQTRRDVQVDWFLQIRDRQPGGALLRRRATVKCRLERRGRGWKITAMEPLSLFAPLPAP